MSPRQILKKWHLISAESSPLEQFKAWRALLKKRKYARRELALFAAQVKAGEMRARVVSRRSIAPALQPRPKGAGHAVLVTEHAPLGPLDVKRVETLLRDVFPQFNRAERRHTARGQRWMFLSTA